MRKKLLEQLFEIHAKLEKQGDEHAANNPKDQYGIAIKRARANGIGIAIRIVQGMPADPEPMLMPGVFTPLAGPELFSPREYEVAINGIERMDYRLLIDVATGGLVILFDALTYEELCNVRIQRRSVPLPEPEPKVSPFPTDGEAERFANYIENTVKRIRGGI